MDNNGSLKFETPNAADCCALSQLVFSSKASHGYDSEFMEACREELIVTPLTLQNGPSCLAWLKDREKPQGFTQIAQNKDGDCELEALFVAPDHQGHGLGQQLFSWATGQARTLGYADLLINSDPGAKRFYLAAGARLIGTAASGSIAGRFLPQLSYALNNIGPDINQSE